jgi:hypothetical protein
MSQVVNRIEGVDDVQICSPLEGDRKVDALTPLILSASILHFF